MTGFFLSTKRCFSKHSSLSLSLSIRLITLAELSAADGVSTPNRWVAFDGKVYDVSFQPDFAEAKGQYHYVLGSDCTDEFCGGGASSSPLGGHLRSERIDEWNHEFSHLDRNLVPIGLLCRDGTASESNTHAELNSLKAQRGRCFTIQELEEYNGDSVVIDLPYNNRDTRIRRECAFLFVPTYPPTHHLTGRRTVFRQKTNIRRTFGECV